MYKLEIKQGYAEVALIFDDLSGAESTIEDILVGAKDIGEKVTCNIEKINKEECEQLEKDIREISDEKPKEWVE